VPADGMSSTTGLIGAEINSNSSTVSSAVACSGTAADDVPCAEGSTAYLGASASCG